MAAEAAAAPVTLSFQTAAFNPTTGVPVLFNGNCLLSASATTAGGTQSAKISTPITLNNADGAVVSNSFTAITNIEGTAQPTGANDQFGLPWHAGSVTVTVVPVLYSNRTLASLNITLPGATGATQTITAAPFTATWSGSASSGSRVTGLTLVDATGCVAPAVPPACGNLEVNGSTPKGVFPAVIALDNNGNDLGIILLPGGLNTTFRLDNTAPQAPLAFNLPGRQSPGWANPTYVFATTGIGGGGGRNVGAVISGASSALGGSDGNEAGTQNFVSCGDGPNVNPFTNTTGSVSPYVCLPQVGVSSSGNGVVGVGTGVTNGQTTFSYYAIPAATYVASGLSPSGTNGTSTSSGACSISGWTKVNTANDLAATTASNVYVVRVFEIDKLGNERCTDLAKAPAAGALGTMINTGVAGTYTANAATFGVDKVAPTVLFLEPGNALCPAGGCVGANGSAGVGAPVPSFSLSMSDDASGFTALPSVSKLTRLAIDPATAAQSLTGLLANGSTLFGCPIGWNGGAGACGTTQTGGTFLVDNGSGVDGYYTLVSKTTDVARNAAPILTRSFVIDRVAPTMGSIAVPSSVTGGASASFATSATDNLDLINYDYTLTYPSAPSGDPATANCAPAAAGTCFPIRSPNTVTGQQINTAFSGTLKPNASFTLNVPFFIRNVATTTAGGAPQNNGVLPTTIAARSYDAAANPSVVTPATGSGFSNIAAAAINTTPAVTNYTAPQPNTATFTTFTETNAVANISNCPAAGCAGGAAPANATSVTLTASAVGTEGAAFQFLNPFTQIQFYYFDTVSNEFILIGSAIAPIVTDNAGLTARTFTWTLTTAFTPPKTLGSGVTLKLIAVGVNSAGDALASAVNANNTLTNP